MKTGLKIFFVAVLISAPIAFYAVAKIKTVAAAYLYGYPLVMIDQSRTTFLGSDQSKANQFKHVQQFPDHNFRNVVRPNNDTLYSIAWIDLGTEPLILSVPNTQGRYYVMPFMDAWSNVFAMVGKRTTGTNAGHYGVVGPGWNNELPKGIAKIQSPTNKVWLIGRIQTNGDRDIANVAVLQKQFSLTPLSKWGLHEQAESIVALADDASENPMAIVDSLDSVEYFARVSKLMGKQAIPNSDSDILNKLKNIGITTDGAFGEVGWLDKVLFDKAVSITKRKLDQRVNSPSVLENGWAVYRSLIGNYGTNYTFRAGVAKIGLGALPPEEAVYPNTKVDLNGDLLSGSKRYKIHFQKGLTPPVNAFWSLSMYDELGFFTDNPIKRYSIGDRDSLEYNVDGSLDIYIQADEPVTGASNWLPSPRANFALTMRLYSPKNSFLNGDWKLPKVEPLP